MFRQLKKTLVATVIASLTLGSILPAFADSADTLPDMGTSAGSTLSIGQEMQMGITMCASCAAARRSSTTLCWCNILTD
jgi:predicted Zn-dependent protease